MKIVAVLCIAASLATSCRPTLVASNYKQSCVADQDCVAVIVGDTCRESCEAAGIHVDEKARHDADISGPCPPRFDYLFAAALGCTLPEPATCDLSEAFCSDGVCAARPAPFEDP